MQLNRYKIFDVNRYNKFNEKYSIGKVIRMYKDERNRVRIDIEFEDKTVSRGRFICELTNI